MPSLIAPSNKILSLPAYTTILCQAFSPKGDYLAVGSERGRIAIFQLSDLVSVGGDDSESGAEKLSCLFYFDVSSDESKKSGGSVNTLATTKTFLIASVSASDNSAGIFAWSWKDLIKSAGLRGTLARPSVAWTIESRCLPSDVNATIVDEKSDVTAGRLFVAGGTSGPSSGFDHAIRVLDLETRSECFAPLKGHEGYIHDISLDHKSNLLASASEDGTVKIWDLRTPNGQAQDIRPSKTANLCRPQLGNWIGAVSLSGEFVGCGGGPKPALFHLRTLSPIDSNGLKLPTCSDNTCSVHVIDIYGDENRVIVGGEFQGKLYQTNLSGELIADIETSSSCIYSVAHWCHENLQILSFAGSSSRIDLCTANFSYVDKTITFPTCV